MKKIMMKLSLICLSAGLLGSCAADGSFATGGKPLDKEQTRLALCTGAQNVDIAFQTFARNEPGIVTPNVMNVEGAIIDGVGFKPGLPDPARDGSICAKVYLGDIQVALNTLIIAIESVSGLIKNWQH